MSLEAAFKAIVKAAVREVLQEDDRFQAALSNWQQQIVTAPVSQPPAKASPPSPVPPAEGTAAPGAVAYEPIGALIKKLAPTKRAEVLAILGKFGAKKGGELKPESYSEVLKALQGLDTVMS